MIHNNIRKLPAYPVFVKDPFFSLWSNTDNPAESNPTFWFGREVAMAGFVFFGKEKYRFFGNGQGRSLSLTGIDVTALKTIYRFGCDKFDMRVEFCSPLPLDNLDVLSFPLCYMFYTVTPKQGAEEVRVTFSVSSDICCPYCENTYARGDVYPLGDVSVGYMGLNRQNILSRCTDKAGADWGWWYLAGKRCVFHDEEDLSDVVEGKKVKPLKKACKKYLTAIDTFKAGGEICGTFAIGFDDVVSVYYYGEILRGYWFSQGKTINDAFRKLYGDFNAFDGLCNAFDKRLNGMIADETYREICTAAYRQSVAAHKLVCDGKGRTLFLSKENSSDGCIATVDVSYPEMPLYLLFAPELVKGTLYPIFDFAEKDVWKKPFAPHDAGVYPYCNGQFYAIRKPEETGGEHLLDYYSEENDEILPPYWCYSEESDIYCSDRQMPVEESANMLIMSELVCEYLNDNGLIKRYFTLLRTWGEFLDEKGLIPENQLSTDDFSGHLNKNINLAVKSALGLKAFALSCMRLGKRKLAEKYMKKAKERAEKISALQNRVLPQAFDDAEDYSLKYNLAADILLGEEIFSQAMKEKETEFYLSVINKFGIPLDSCHVWTKSDWMCWAASMSEDKKKREKIYASLKVFLTESPDRVPFSDWFDTDTGKIRGFQARSVQGGVFMPILADHARRKKEKKS